MQAVRNLIDLLFGRVTGMNTMEFSGTKYLVAPVIAGGAPEDEDDDKGDDGDEDDKGADEDDKGTAGDDDDDKGADDDDEKLGEAGKAALAAERKARRDAERRAKAAEKKLSDAEEAELGEKEKAERRAEKAEERSGAATAKLRKANLLTHLSDDLKLTGSKAKAAIRLLEGLVEFDEDDDEPTNLKDAIKAAKAEFGEDAFKAATATTTSTDDADQGARQGGGSDKPKGLKGAIAASLKNDE